MRQKGERRGKAKTQHSTTELSWCPPCTRCTSCTCAEVNPYRTPCFACTTCIPAHSRTRRSPSGLAHAHQHGVGPSLALCPNGSGPTSCPLAPPGLWDHRKGSKDCKL